MAENTRNRLKWRLVLLALALAALLFHVPEGHAVPIVGGTDFVFTSDGGKIESSGDPANTADGNTANGPFSDQTIGVRYTITGPNTPIETLPITLVYTFNELFDITGDFTLYNGWDLSGQAIDAFTLTFFDTGGIQIGSPFSGNGSAAVTTDVFALGTTFPDVQSVELQVTSVHSGELEFREIAFEGSASSPSPLSGPSTALLLGAGVLGLVLRRRRRG